jgi:hypothetical protein
MNLREAIVKKLEDNAELMEAAKEVWFGLADKGEETNTPYVIVAKYTGTPEHAFQGDPLDWDIWTVKGVGEVDTAERIAELIDTILSDAELIVEGRDVKYLRRYNDINYAEAVDGERYQHIGANYRITSEKEEV